MTSIEDRLKGLEDRDAIHQLFIDYGHFLDAGDLDGYAGLFALEGEVLLGPVGRAKGRDNIRELMSKALDGRVGTAYHIISGPRVALDGDRATAEVMWSVISRDADGKPHLTSTGRHIDDLVRESGVWRIAKRRGLVDLPERMPLPTRSVTRTASTCQGAVARATKGRTSAVRPYPKSTSGFLRRVRSAT